MPNHDIRSLQPHKYLRALGLVLFGALCGVQVAAQTTAAADKAFGAFMTNVVGAGQQTVSFASNGQATIATANGNLAMSAAGAVSIGGKSLPVTVSAAPSMSGVQGVGKLAIGLAKVAGPVGIAVAAYDLFSAVKDFGVTYKSPGVLDITKTTKTLDRVYTLFGCDGPVIVGSFSSVTTACADKMVADPWFTNNHHTGPMTVTLSWESGDTGGVTFRSSDISAYIANLTFKYVIIQGSRTDPATEDELANAIASQSGWPSSVREKAVKTLIDSGNSPALDETTKTITGPNTLGEPKVTTKNNPDGTVEKTTETQKVTYEGNKITVSNSSVVTNYNPVTNNTTTTTTETDNPDLPKDDPKTDCEKNPKAIGCQEIDFDAPTGEIPKSTRNITFQAEDLGFGGGTCPADVMLTPHGMAQIKAFDWLAACDTITTYVKPMMLALAGFAALMIIFAGGRTE